MGPEAAFSAFVMMSLPRCGMNGARRRARGRWLAVKRPSYAVVLHGHRSARTNAGSAFCVAFPAPGCKEHDARNGYRKQKKLEHSIASVWCETKQPLDEIHVLLLALVD